MRYLILPFLLSLSLFMSAQTATIRATEIKPWTGNWKGTFRYYDVSGGVQLELKVKVKIGPVTDGNKIPFLETYADAPEKNLVDTLRISDDGMAMNFMDLSTKKKSGETLTLVFTTEGEDDNHKAEIRVTYSLLKNKINITREVRHRGRNEYITRYNYTLTGDNSP